MISISAEVAKICKTECHTNVMMQMTRDVKSGEQCEHIRPISPLTYECSYKSDHIDTCNYSSPSICLCANIHVHP